MAKANYRSIERKIWQDKKIKALSLESKLLFLYLITNNQSHYSGIYYLPLELIIRELPQFTNKKIKIVILELISSQLICYDDENSIIWIKNMAKYQCKGISPKLIQGIINHLETIESPLIKDFQTYYSDTLSDTLSDTPRCISRIEIENRDIEYKNRDTQKKRQQQTDEIDLGW